MPFEKAHKQAIEFLKNWIEGGCDNTKFTEIRTKVMQLAAWVSRGVCEEEPSTESISPHISPMALQASNKTSMPDRLNKLMEGYKKAMQEWTDNPSKQTLHKLEKAMAQITSFLREHKEEIFKIAKNNGWPTSDPGSDYENYFQSAMDAMKNFKKNPNMGSAVFANECLTQIHWLLTNAS